jgi:hypothetical protein
MKEYCNFGVLFQIFHFEYIYYISLIFHGRLLLQPVLSEIKIMVENTELHSVNDHNC